MSWQDGTITLNGQDWATRTESGIDLMYGGPDGLLYYRGELVGTSERYYEILAAIREERARIKATN